MSVDRRARSAHRTPLRIVLAVLLAGAFAALTLAPAQAAAYRYWGFYQLTDGTWGYAQKGPDQTVPADGSVEGWRFAVGDEQSTRLPRAVLTFDELCGSTPAAAGQKRVGLVIDFGRAVDAVDPSTTPPEPAARCATVPTDGTSTDVLAEAGRLRVEKGLVCAVADYPATDCGGEVKEVTAAVTAADTPVTIAAPSAATATTAPAAPATTEPGATAAPATQATSSSAGTVAAYVIATIALLAIIAYLVVRSRRRAGSAS